jgi:DNA-binding beta-propeller fold protein YncE
MLNKRILLGATALLALGTLVVAACTSSVSQKDFDALKAQLEASKAGVVQAGNLQPAPAAAKLTGWDTPESIRGGLQVVATYDSDGPAAWDPVAHPLVYYTSEGMGYGHRPSKTAKFPGMQIIDAGTKQVVASRQFDLGYELHGTPHNAGMSPDGKWIYVATSDGAAHAMTGTGPKSNLMIINAKTLKLDMMLAQAKPERGFHHMTAFKDWQGRDRVLVQTQDGPYFILDPKENHKVVRTITREEVGKMGHPYATVDPSGKFLYVANSSTEVREAPFEGAAISKVNLETGTVKVIPETGNWPIGIVHTADGKFTYVADGHGSKVIKIDNATDKIVGRTSAGVAGPYGLAINWDETELYTMGKGEGSHNTGGVVGVIDLKTFRPTQKFDQPMNIGGSIIDHGILHPDPNVNEMWVSSAGTWETIVVDLNTYKVKARIPSPNGGDTHSGGFVRYNPDFTGEVLADMGGPQREMYATRKANAAKLVAAKP